MSAWQGSKGPMPKPKGLPLVYSLELHRLNRAGVLRRFREACGDKGAVLFFAGGAESTAMRHDTDHEDVFRQESTFHYLFGVKDPDYLGVLDVDSGKATLFAPRLPEEYAVWMGKIKSNEEIKEIYGVDEVAYADEVASWFKSRAPASVHLQKGKNSDTGNEVVPAGFEGLRDSFKVETELLHDVVYESRAHKNEEELKLLRYVNRISSDAHLEMMRQAKPGMMEYQLESIFAYSCYFNGGCRLMSYTPIAGSGANSAVLHYGHAGAPNNGELKEGDMVLCDMGSEIYCYASDITNSFPAGGKFTEGQRVVFEAVAAMQAAVLESMKPGVKWADMQVLAYKVLCEHFLAAGLLNGDLDAMAEANVAAVFMPHGLGHFMGIDTHDVGGYPKGAVRDKRDGFKALRAQRVLEPGMVLTVEPGCYFVPYTLEKAQADEGLSKFFCWKKIDEFRNFGGVRLEDNVVVTEDGIENLTVAPRTVDEVEAVMRGEVVDSEGLLTFREAV